MRASTSPGSPSTLASSSTTEAEGDGSGARPRQVLLVAWRGDAFVGWQRQPAGRSVQVVLEDALRTLHGGADTHALAAGRTDAGVHAWAQVVRIDAATLRRPEATLRGLHALLPPDLSCLAVGAAPPGFHPVRDAVEKHYRYRILARGTRCPFREGAVWRLHHDLDRGAMAEAGAALCGRHDFSSFRAAGCSAPDVVKELRALTVTVRGDELHVDVIGDGFLRHQVRIIVGTLVEVGIGRLTPAAVGAALAAQRREAAGPTAPPGGLWLVGPRFDPPLSWDAGGAPTGAPGEGPA